MFFQRFDKAIRLVMYCIYIYVLKATKSYEQQFTDR